MPAVLSCWLLTHSVLPAICKAVSLFVDSKLFPERGRGSRGTTVNSGNRLQPLCRQGEFTQVLDASPLLRRELLIAPQNFWT